MRRSVRGTKRKLAGETPTANVARSSKKAACAVPDTAQDSSSKQQEEGAVRLALEPIDVRSDADADELTDEQIIASHLSAMIGRVRDIFDGVISAEAVADAALQQKLVSRPPKDIRVGFLLKAKAAFLEKLKDTGGFKEGNVEGVGDCMFIAPQAYHEIAHPAELDDATRDQKVTSMRKSIVGAIGAGKRTTSMVPLNLRQAIVSYYGADELKVRLRLTVFITPVRLHLSLRAHRLLDVSRALS
jgi:hypothetical protein